MRSNQARRLRAKVDGWLFAEHASEAALDAAIEEELAKMTPEEARRSLEEFLAEIGKPLEME
jgi:hypothetical protein